MHSSGCVYCFLGWDLGPFEEAAKNAPNVDVCFDIALPLEDVRVDERANHHPGDLLADAEVVEAIEGCVYGLILPDISCVTIVLANDPASNSEDSFVTFGESVQGILLTLGVPFLQ